MRPAAPKKTRRWCCAIGVPMSDIQSRARIGPVFLTIWLGQLISSLGSGLTTFALGVYIFQATHSVTQFSVIVVFGSLPGILLAPLAGVLADRWNRGTAMAVSQAGSALCVLSMSLLLMMGRLDLWEICLAVAAGSVFHSLQWTSFSAATTGLVPKASLGRASGMVQLAQTMSLILSPLIAGPLIMLIPIGAILLLDVLSYFVAFMTVVLVPIPNPPRTIAKTENTTMAVEMKQGWNYIRERHGLFYLLLFFTATNFAMAVTYVLITPMMLSFASPMVLSRIISAFGLGLVISGVVMSLWRGPSARIRVVLWVVFFQGLGLLLCGVHQNTWLIAAGLCIVGLGIPIVNACTQAIWQTKTAPEIQGRVFAVRRMLVQAAAPVAYLIAGPLADRVFGPLLAVGGAWTNSVGRVIGVGPSRGIAFLFILAGAMVTLTAIVSWMARPLRQIESDVPDALQEPHVIAGEMPAAAA
jgi:DHA3 family macrolide efflux protein-like MFS transporter